MRDFTTQFLVMLVSGAVLLMATPQPVLADDMGTGGEAESASAALAGVVRELQDEVQKLRDELAEMKTSATPAVSAAADGDALTLTNYSLTPESYDIHSSKQTAYRTPSSFLEWHGYLDTEFDKEDGENSNFDNHEFYLSAKATISEKLLMVAEFEYEHTPEKLILPIQAYTQYKAFDRYASGRAGLFHVPIGLPRRYTLRGSTNRTVRQVALTHDLMFENWSMVGLEMFGDVPLNDFGDAVFYDVAIGNGLRGYANGDSWFDADDNLQNHTEDNNYNKLVALRAGLSFTDIAGFDGSVAGSWATQQYDPGDRRNRRLTHIGADLLMRHDSGFRIQAEWMKRTGGDNQVELDSGTTADADGWYVQLSQRTFEEAGEYMNYLDFVFQVDGIDTNDMERSALMTIAPALIWSPEPFLQIKAEYDFVLEHSSSGGYKMTDTHNNKFWAAVVVEF